MTRSTGFATQGTQLAIETTPGSAITITGVTKASSAVVTGTHSLAVGDEVEFGTVTGMPEGVSCIGAAFPRWTRPDGRTAYGPSLVDAVVSDVT